MEREGAPHAEPPQEPSLEPHPKPQAPSEPPLTADPPQKACSCWGRNKSSRCLPIKKRTLRHGKTSSWVSGQLGTPNPSQILGASLSPLQRYLVSVKLSVFLVISISHVHILKEGHFGGPPRFKCFPIQIHGQILASHPSLQMVTCLCKSPPAASFCSRLLVAFRDATRSLARVGVGPALRPGLDHLAARAA